MRRETRRRRLLDLGTTFMVLAAAGLLVESRVLPAWRASRIVEVGERLPDELRVRSLVADDTLDVDAALPTMLLFFRSDCPACDRALPAWRRLVRVGGGRVRSLAVALEPPGPALAWVRRELPAALAVRPERPEELLRRLAVRRVPTTLLVGSRGRLRYRREGVPGAVDGDSLLALAGIRPPGSGVRPRLPGRPPDGEARPGR